MFCVFVTVAFLCRCKNTPITELLHPRFNIIVKLKYRTYTYTTLLWYFSHRPHTQIENPDCWQLGTIQAEADGGLIMTDRLKRSRQVTSNSRQTSHIRFCTLL